MALPSLNCCTALAKIPRQGAARCSPVLQEDVNLTPQAEAVLAADDRAGMMAAQALPDSETLLASILSSLDDDKGEDIVQIDLRGRSAFGDYMVVASGRSTRQVAAMAEKLANRLKSAFSMSVRIEGKDTGDWVLIDTGDVVVHLFRPEVREFYQLEKMRQPQGAAN